MSLSTDPAVEVRNVDLSFMRKVRGIAPLSRFAAHADGSVLISAPDDLEVRSSHLVRFSPTGKPQTLQSFSVETLRRTEIATAGDTFIGSTDDDLYIFKDARKTRFLSDRRANYADIALNESGNRFGAVFCDMLASSHTVALGDGTGRALWTKDLPFAAACISVSRNGDLIAIGGEDGDLWLLDNARNVLIKHRQEAPMDAVVVGDAQRLAFIGGGGAGMVTGEGQLLWFTEATGEAVAIGLDTQARTVAVLLKTDYNEGKLLLLSGDTGLPVWEVEFDESRPTGLSISASGEFVAVTLRDGTVSVYRLFYGDRLAAADGDAVLAEARAARAGEGSLAAAVTLLTARLASVPSDHRACDLLRETLADLKAQAINAAANAETVGDFSGADDRLAEAVAALPYDPELFTARQTLRARWNVAEKTAGEQALNTGDGDAAERHLLAAIAADPLDAAARERLADARHAAADAAIHDGKKRIDAGEWPEAIAALTEAMRRGASGPNVTNLLQQARIGEAMALGNSLYNDRQYAAALFQFKKALRLDPDHAEAKQRISYAQNFLADASQITERFTRLE